MAGNKARSKRTPRRTSLRDLARITGFSPTTISMVVNGRAADYAISDETRDLVLAAAREHHYQPNVHARSLASHTTNLVGLVVPTLRNSFFGLMVEAFENLARNDGKLSLFAVTHYDAGEELRAVNYFVSQNVDCIFTANPVALDDVSALCARAGTRQIVLDAPRSGCPTVTTDNVESARELTSRLLGSIAGRGLPGGIYFVGGPAEHEVTRLRLSGFRAALRAAGLRFTEDLFLPTAFEGQAAYEALARILASGRPIAGLFLNSLPPLEGFVRVFAEQPARCQSIHYAVFDHHPMMRLLTGHFVCAVKQDPERMMRTAYALLERGEELSKPALYLVPYELVEPGAETAAGASTPGAPPPTRGAAGGRPARRRTARARA